LTSHTSKQKHELNGDWSMTGVVKQLDSLTKTLNTLNPDQNKILHVDCNKKEKYHVGKYVDTVG